MALTFSIDFFFLHRFLNPLGRNCISPSWNWTFSLNGTLFRRSTTMTGGSGGWWRRARTSVSSPARSNWRRWGLSKASRLAILVSMQAKLRRRPTWAPSTTYSPTARVPIPADPLRPHPVTCNFCYSARNFNCVQLTFKNWDLKFHLKLVAGWTRKSV